MQKFPIGLQDFKSLREGNFTYVDKTAHIHKLVTTGKYYFLSRPRRFGKSLTVSVLSELFKGSKQLFEGLWIEDRWNWERKNPVIQIGFSSMGYQTAGLEKAIYRRLALEANKYQIELIEEGYDYQFKELIAKLAAKQGKVVVLIDEYDKPIIDYLEDVETAKTQRDILKTFYSVLKDADEYLEFVFITGVSKFSKTSIFSELNNLQDITMSRDFNALCGYTQTDVEQNFTQQIELFSRELEKSTDWTLAEIKRWYNGYAWGNVKETVYNPFSILIALKDLSFQNYWFESGTPTFLIKLLRKHQFYDIKNIKATAGAFGSYELGKLSPETLLFQTGYITIKKDLGLGLYELGYPNHEVKNSLLRYLLDDYTNGGQGLAAAPALLMAHALRDENTDELKKQINALLHSIPYELHQDNEAYYHTVMHLAFSLIGVYIQSELHVAKGRIDFVAQTEHAVYIFEFKVNSTAKVALEQIREKAYAQPFRSQGRKIYCIGVSFNTTSKEVDSWLIEELS